MKRDITPPQSRTDAELLAAVRDALYRIATGHQSYTVDGVTYTRANLRELKELEAQLAQRTGLANAPGGGVRHWQVRF